ncbi:mRNA N(3)-methylcytidine methyltransferase METTL8 isoform X2 [Coregonus clupeaformis]|uniref:mRNA N(3)-methylcytidine methyltransferase METTL8 isoform X2 n=1 Tax=Coregonus clupeaformis TaxID=59861 RepID=UPI001BE0DBB5|nr:mRNA N(3)-methylcytidine methyltransferase METTL8 isoform X2 [Coregonus clupeaformis]
MRGLRHLSLASVAMVWGRVPCRLNSRGGRPPAPLGARILTNSEDIFQHNMWDHVKWSEEEKEKARQKADDNSSLRIPLEEQDACKYWDSFYEMHQDKFFKDRKWLFLEFPELLPLGPESSATEERQCGLRATCPEPGVSGRDTEMGKQRQHAPSHQHIDPLTSDCQQSCNQDGRDTAEAARQTSSFPGEHATFRILEVGCGAGNSVYPIVSSIKGTGAFLYCCDFSPRAVQLVKDHPNYDQSVCHAFVQDVCDEVGYFPFPPLSLDVILLVFVLSSIHPKRVQGVVTRLSQFLKPGGIFLFRDYGRYDLSQLRFKKGRCLSENFYSRGDGTCVYFFTKDEVHHLFSNAGLEEIQNLEDRRLQVNRGKKVVMHRVWMQSKFKKPQPLAPPS